MLIGLVGEGLSGTERTEAAWVEIVPKGLLVFPGLCGLVKEPVCSLGSGRGPGGTDRATDGGLLGGPRDGALSPTVVLDGVAGVDLSLR